MNMIAILISETISALLEFVSVDKYFLDLIKSHYFWKASNGHIFAFITCSLILLLYRKVKSGFCGQVSLEQQKIYKYQSTCTTISCFSNNQSSIVNYTNENEKIIVNNNKIEK